MLVIKHYYKLELEKEYYCRTEEKAFEIVKKIIEKVGISNQIQQQNDSLSKNLMDISCIISNYFSAFCVRVIFLKVHSVAHCWAFSAV